VLGAILSACLATNLDHVSIYTVSTENLSYIIVQHTYSVYNMNWFSILTVSIHCVWCKSVIALLLLKTALISSSIWLQNVLQFWFQHWRSTENTTGGLILALRFRWHLFSLSLQHLTNCCWVESDIYNVIGRQKHSKICQQDIMTNC